MPYGQAIAAGTFNYTLSGGANASSSLQQTGSVINLDAPTGLVLSTPYSHSDTWSEATTLNETGGWSPTSSLAIASYGSTLAKQETASDTVDTTHTASMNITYAATVTTTPGSNVGITNETISGNVQAWTGSNSVNSSLNGGGVSYPSLALPSNLQWLGLMQSYNAAPYFATNNVASIASLAAINRELPTGALPSDGALTGVPTSSGALSATRLRRRVCIRLRQLDHAADQRQPLVADAGRPLRQHGDDAQCLALIRQLHRRQWTAASRGRQTDGAARQPADPLRGMGLRVPRRRQHVAAEERDRHHAIAGAVGGGGGLAVFLAGRRRHLHNGRP